MAAQLEFLNGNHYVTLDINPANRGGPEKKNGKPHFVLPYPDFVELMMLTLGRWPGVTLPAKFGSRQKIIKPVTLLAILKRVTIADHDKDVPDHFEALMYPLDRDNTCTTVKDIYQLRLNADQFALRALSHLLNQLYISLDGYSVNAKVAFRGRWFTMLDNCK